MILAMLELMQKSEVGRGGPVFEAFRIAFIEISVGIEANSLKGGLAARGQRDASMS